MKLIKIFFIILFFNLISSDKNLTIETEKSKLFSEIYDLLTPGGYFFDSLEKILTLKKENKILDKNLLNKLKEEVEKKINLLGEENKENVFFKILELLYSQLILLSSEEKNNDTNLKNEEKKFYSNLKKFIFNFLNSTKILYEKTSKALFEFIRKRKIIKGGEALIEKSFKEFMSEVEGFKNSLKT